MNDLVFDNRSRDCGSRRRAAPPPVLAAVLVACIVLAAAASAAAARTMPAFAAADSARTAASGESRDRSPEAALSVSHDELAVFFAPRVRVTGALMRAVARRLGALAGPLPGSSEYVMFVRLSRGDMRAAARTAELSLSGERRVAAVGPVFFRDAPGVATRVVPTGAVVVRYRDAGALRRAARAVGDGSARGREVRAAPRAGTAVLRVASPLAALAAADRLDRLPGIVSVTPDWYRPRFARAIPDDPLFAQQWHLDNVESDVDVNVVSVWDTFTGTSEQVVAIVDDGVELKHTDLTANVVSGISWDFVGGDANPAPGWWDDHGTACAGVTAARGFNGRGVSGAAPRAGLVGMRLLGASSDANEAAALTRSQDTIDVRSCSWGPVDDRHLEGPGPLTAAALADGVVNGRGGRGTVFVWAGGNGQEQDDDVNFDGYANSRFVAAVAACDEDGYQSYYSERGASLLITAPSSGGYGSGITTVDRTGSAGYSAGDYTNSFGGTSAAAPLVAGCVALMLQANPDLTWRDVQAILAATAVKNDAADPGWTKNGADYDVSHKYGFGLIDTQAAVAAAATWTTVGAEVHAEASAAPAAEIPDDDLTGVTSQVAIVDDITIESVDVVLTAPHSNWSDLRIELTSPEGTSSLLAEESPTSGGDDGYVAWRFMTRRCLGESSLGTWTLRVSDRVDGHVDDHVDKLASWTLRVHGRPTGPWVDVTPPFTTAIGAAGWHATAATVVLDTFDPDSAVAKTEYRLDGVDPWIEGTQVTVEAPADHSNDKLHLLEYRSYDVNGAVEGVRSTNVAIDTLGPDARAPRRASVRRGSSVKLSYRVNDALSPRAAVTIRVKRLSGRTVRLFTLVDRPTNVTLGKSFRCRLARGTYRIVVRASDLAGNAEVHVGTNRLVVR